MSSPQKCEDPGEGAAKAAVEAADANKSTETVAEDGRQDEEGESGRKFTEKLETDIWLASFQKRRFPLASWRESVLRGPGPSASVCPSAAIKAPRPGTGGKTSSARSTPAKSVSSPW